MSNKTALIIGAGPAGLTAAYELLQRTDTRPVVLEKSEYMGGISRTVNYKGNRIDIGGHRFFSKSDRVMNWWMAVMPLEARNGAPASISYQNQTREVATSTAGPTPENTDKVMLIRRRKSRIYFLRRFFDYPIKLTKDTLAKLGVVRTIKIGMSYSLALVSQIKPEKSLEQFLINRFGKELYLLFFKSYTEKVWGVPCDQISAEWGAQRIKGLSITKAISHFVKSAFASKKAHDISQRDISQKDISQKDTETSLIEQFMYPKLGPGQLWEYVAETVQQQGGTVQTGWNVEKIHAEGNRILSVEAVHDNGERRTIEADYFFSTMPVRELINALDAPVPANVRQVSDGLIYRDFITVGLLLKRLQVRDDSTHGAKLLTDNWIYIQEPDVQVGRMQIFNNWSPYLVADPNLVWVGLEYFCYDTDALWKMPDADIIALAKEEVERIGIISREDVVDATVIRVPKTYPAYFGTYDRFGEIREYVNGFENLFLIGRNGMHKYNNQDHSMLTAMTAVDNIAAGITNKDNLWAVNTEMEYHEGKDK